MIKKPTKGQFNMIAKSKFKNLVDGIFEREYYTNHGPLLKELEDKLCNRYNTRHAICMANRDIALMIAFLALEIEGEIILPTFSHVSFSQTASMLNLKIKYCDASKSSPNMDVSMLKKEITDKTSAILGISNWGERWDTASAKDVIEANNLKLIFESSDIFGQLYEGNLIGGNKNIEVFSFHERELINGGDGACVTTNDDELAERLRNIRSSYGARYKVNIPFTGNGRMSEIQAGLILLSMEEMENNIQLNKKRYAIYKENLDSLIGVSIYCPSARNSNLNYSKIVLCTDKTSKYSARKIGEYLEAKGLIGYHSFNHGKASQMENYPQAKYYIENSLILPNSNQLDIEFINNICEEISKFFALKKEF